MRVDETGDGVRVHIGRPEYRALVRASETYREELVVRLGADVGLGPAEMTRIRPAHIRTHQHAGVEHFFLTVPDGDGGSRSAYLPPDVEHALRQFARAEGIADDEAYVPVTPRRVQMLVSEIADRAASRTGDDRLREVSSRTVRRYFAQQLLVDEWVDPRVVTAVGGWDRVESLEPYLEEPSRDDIVSAFERTALSPERDRRGADEQTTPATPVDSVRLGPVIDQLQQVGSAIATSTSPADVQQAACRELVDGGAYRCAWIAERTTESLELVAHAGEDATGLESLAVVEGAVGTALRDGTVQATTAIAQDSAFSGWRDHATAAGYQAGAVVPVTDGETTVGVLGVGVDADDAFEERERTLLADFGVRLGAAITAAQQRRFMLADTAVELGFECSDDAAFFVAASAAHSCSFSLEGVVPGEEQSLLYFVTLAGAQPGPVLEWAGTTDGITDARLVREYADEALLEFVLTGDSLSKRLVEHGATVTEMTAEHGTLTVEGELPATADVRTVVDDVVATFPDTDLLTKRERERPVEPMTSFKSSLRENLTEKQAAVLQAAYHAGYFEWPRGSTAEELADAIGITSPTLHNHLRRAQQKLLSTFYDETQHYSSVTPWAE